MAQRMPPQQGGPPTVKDFNDGAIPHYLALLGVIGPIIWLVASSNKSPFVRANTMSALNFAISLAIYNVGIVIVGFVLGLGLGLALGVAWIIAVTILLWAVAVLGLFIWYLVSCLQGATAAKRGEVHKYKGAFNFVKP